MSDEKNTTLEPIRTGGAQASNGRPARTDTSIPRSRSNSGPSRPDSRYLHRLVSGQYLDDQSVYHHEHAAGEEDRREQDAADEEDSFDGQEKRDECDHLDSVSSQDKEREEVEGPQDILGETEATSRAEDLEAGPPPSIKRMPTNKSVKDPNLVTWDSPTDPQNPKNWSTKRKWIATLVVSSFTFISPVSSSMVAPALGNIARDFHITNEAEEELVLSIFVLAYAIGPLFLGPLSELFGRVRVLQLANLFFLVWNIACGFAQTSTQMMLFRFLSGLGGSAPLAIGGGLLGDCWKAEERGRAISVYSLAPLLGPAVGPIAGGFIAETVSWRWCFYSTSIATGLIQISGIFFLQETYIPELLKRKKLRLIKETGNKDLHTEYDDPDRRLVIHIRTAFVRPFRLLFTQPIIVVLALYIAYVYGTMYLVLASFPSLWTSPDYYNESVGIGGLNYISLGLGFFLGAQIGAPFNDRIYRRLKAKNDNQGRAEFRVPLMFPAALITPIGLFIYGWTANARTHWIFPNIGAMLFSFGTITVFQACQTYIIDAYTRYAASAIASTTVIRSLAGFGFPLFSLSMYNALGYGWGNSVLAFAALALGIPAPILLWFYGQRLREKSKFAAGGF